LICVRLPLTAPTHGVGSLANRGAAAFLSALRSRGLLRHLTAATALGVGFTLSPINPIEALYWAAVINGVVAVPVMITMMLMTAQPRIMGKFVIGGWLRWLGWAATAAMAACVVGMVIGWIV
jgi:Mn2+/Fe2+ NRAMP family transporter